MSLSEHLDSLRSKHAGLKRSIDDEMHRPMPDQELVARLKREKLRIKDELSRLSDAPPPRARADLHPTA